MWPMAGAGVTSDATKGKGDTQIGATSRCILDTRADALLTGCLMGLLATGNLLPQSKWFR